MMTGDELYHARCKLGEALGVTMTQYRFARLLGMWERFAHKKISEWERGVKHVPGPVATCIDMMLQGCMPTDLKSRLRAPGYKRASWAPPTGRARVFHAGKRDQFRVIAAPQDQSCEPDGSE